VEQRATVSELWIGYYKRGVEIEGVTYEVAVEEAVCFGGIDGQVRSLDERSYTNRYTPRTSSSPWSAVDIRKAKGLTATGRMHPAGLAAFRAGGENRPARYRFEQPPVDLPRALEDEFRQRRDARSFFARRPPGYRKLWTGWVAVARRPEAPRRRWDAVIAASARGERLDPMRPYRSRTSGPTGPRRSAVPRRI
jgi:uncharacterized protein YdeI (YjbR/CyaY-like superfamily)